MIQADEVRSLFEAHAKDAPDAQVTIPVSLLLDMCEAILNVHTISEALSTHLPWVSLARALTVSANNDTSTLRKMSHS